MNETLQNYKNRITDFWTSKSKKQKLIISGSTILAILLIITISYFATRTPMAPLYSNLTPSETGAIKESLDERGIKSEIVDNGTTIKVPEKNIDALKVELAAEGIPKSGSIDYSFFSQNAGFGTTDNEFNVMKLDAMQTELANLITEIDGVNQAKVMIQLPEKSLFVNDTSEEASASIILNTKPGVEFSEKQIRSLYHLVSKSIPNLPMENIVIMNQFFDYFDLNSENTSGDQFAQQMEIKKQVERDIQRQIQHMLGTIIGQDKVVTAVTADLDFTQENIEENLVEPVDEENMKGLAISVQRITETFSGDGALEGGIPQGGDPADTLQGQYLEGTAGNGDYERIEETMNNEVNKIRKEIVKSPYKVQDLGIQVMVEPPKNEETIGDARIEDIERVLATIIRASINKDTNMDLSDEAIQNKIVVSEQPFDGKVSFEEEEITSKLPWWAYVIGGVLLAVILVLVFLMVRKRKEEEAFEEVLEEEEEPIHVPDIEEEVETESSIRRKQLEKMAKEKPEEFAKLLRSWLAED